MTTICYRDNEIAYDSQVTAGERIVDSQYDKRKNVEGYNFFCAGSVIDIDKLIAAVFDEDFEIHPKKEGCLEAVGFIVTPERVVYKCGYQDDELILIPAVSGRHDAIGSGEEYAIGAMDAGCSAREAVKIAAGRDIYTGGRIRVFKIGVGK